MNCDYKESEIVTVQNDGKVFLTLSEVKNKPKRYIGTISNRTFHTFRNPQKHLHKKSNSIGMNYKLLSRGSPFFDYIKINYGSQVLETTREYFLECGIFLHFKNPGFEKQKFLPLYMFGMSDAIQWREKQDADFGKLNNKITGFSGAISELKNNYIQKSLF